MKYSNKIILTSVLFNIFIFTTLYFYFSNNKAEKRKSFSNISFINNKKNNFQSESKPKSMKKSNDFKLKHLNSNNQNVFKKISNRLHSLEKKHAELKTKRNKFNNILASRNKNRSIQNRNVFDSALIDNSEAKKFRSLLADTLHTSNTEHQDVKNLINEQENNYIKVCTKLLHAEQLLKGKDFTGVIQVLNSDKIIEDYFDYSFNDTNIENSANLLKGLAYFKLGQFDNSHECFEKIIAKGAINKNDNKLLDIAIKSINILNS